MALVVEDGTGLINAESYVSVAQIDSYADKFGKEGWSTLTEAQKEIHARRATRFIDNKYQFDAIPLNADQTLVFPAMEFWVRGRKITGVPVQLKDAVCELAVISVTNDLIDSVGSRAYTYRSVKVGDLEKTERFSSQDNQNIFYSVELLLKPLLPGSIGRGVQAIQLRRA